MYVPGSSLPQALKGKHMPDWNDLLYRTLAWEHLDWHGFHHAKIQQHGVFVNVGYRDAVYCRDEADFYVLAKEFPDVLYKPCDCKKSRIELPVWDAFLEHGLDSQRFIKWCEEKKMAVKFDWGNDKEEGFQCPDVLWHFDVDGTRRFHIRRVQPLSYVDAAILTLETNEERFQNLAKEYREACYERAGLPAKKEKWAEGKIAVDARTP